MRVKSHRAVALGRSIRIKYVRRYETRAWEDGRAMAKKRNGRQDAIREIVRNKDVRTQCMLVEELKKCGFD